jgi:lipopolysaccharide export system permease protein
MQFFWKYVDDIMGKGVEFSVLFKLLFYLSADVIPLALPIAVLFSSIMTMGNLAESNELTSMKSSGMSLFKVMKPMLVLMVALSMSTFYFSNYILPIANLKLTTIIYDLQQKKTSFALTEGVFYGGIDSYLIKVDKKDKDTGELYGVLIYENDGKTIKAEKGELLTSENEKFLLLKLTNGSMYEEAKLDFNPKAGAPFRKSFFEESIVKFDMSGFSMENSDEDLFNREYEMMNYAQLSIAIDSLGYRNDSLAKIYSSSFYTDNVIYDKVSLGDIPIDTNAATDVQVYQKTEDIMKLEDINSSTLNVALSSAQNKLRGKKDFIMMSQQLQKMRNSNFKDYLTEWHRKFTLSFAIIVLFFVGAPLGAIIKKGGLGAPLIFATLFFLMYYMLSITGENMIDADMISPLNGMWMSTMTLVPIGLFLTYKAANDSSLFDFELYKKFFKKIIKR